MGPVGRMFPVDRIRNDDWPVTTVDIGRTRLFKTETKRPIMSVMFPFDLKKRLFSMVRLNLAFSCVIFSAIANGRLLSPQRFNNPQMRHASHKSRSSHESHHLGPGFKILSDYRRAKSQVHR